MISKGSYDNGFIWNPSNCNFKCDNSYDVGEYSDYESRRCTKKLFDKLVKECNEEI